MPNRRPWLRLYTSWRTDERVQALSPYLRAVAINLLCLAGECDPHGTIQLSPGQPFPPHSLARALNVDPAALASVLDRLQTAAVFGLSRRSDGTWLLGKWPASQTSDPTASERVSRYRANLDNRNTAVTPTVTPTVTVTPNVTVQSRVEESRVDVNPLLSPVAAAPGDIPPPAGDAHSSVLTPKKKKPPAPTKTAYLENVLLTEDEYAKLVARFGQDGTAQRIETLSLYIASKGVKYRSHYATILVWERRHETGGNANGRPPAAGESQGHPKPDVDAFEREWGFGKYDRPGHLREVPAVP